MRRSLFILKGRLNNIPLPVDLADSFLEGEPVVECSFSENSIISWGILSKLHINQFHFQNAQNKNKPFYNKT
jgi:hypothetical protein